MKPVGTIWAVGRNYAAHAAELNNEVPAQEPVIFLKSGGCIVPYGEPIQLPKHHTGIHHELEFAFQFDDRLQLSRACLALDLTDRSYQERLKNKGLPWTLAKSFKGACPLGPPFDFQMSDLPKMTLELRVNGGLRQKASTQDMIFSVPTLVEFLIERMPVRPGDLLLTGTPSGVAEIFSGDSLTGDIPGFAAHAEWKVL